MPDERDTFAEAEEFLEEAKRWCEEPTPDGVSERLAAQIEAVEAMTARVRRHRLVCVECGRSSEGNARGWRAFLTVDDEVATYCSECAEAEFDG